MCPLCLSQVPTLHPLPASGPTPAGLLSSCLCPFSSEQFRGAGRLLSFLKAQPKYFSDFFDYLLPPVFNLSPRLPEICLTSWPLPAGPLPQCGVALGSQSASLPGSGRPPPHPCFSSICFTVGNRWSQKEPWMAVPALSHSTDGELKPRVGQLGFQLCRGRGQTGVGGAAP